MLQVARVLSRTRTLLVCHPPCPSPQRQGLPVSGLQNHLCLIKEELHKPSLFRHFSSANACQNPPLRPLLRPHVSSTDNGRRLGQVIGLLFGASYLSRHQGLASIAKCENEPDVKLHYPGEGVSRNYRQSQLRRVVKKLWVPSLCVLTISLGWHHPFSLLLNLLFLMWSTKPTPSSIYLWVEQVRQDESLRSNALDRMRAQASGVMHVEVRDNMLFCLARVTSFTKRSTLLGFMGDWWVIYSSSSAIHTGVKLRNLLPSITPFSREKYN